MTQDQHQLLDQTLSGLNHGDPAYFKSLTTTEKEYVITILRELSEHGYSPSWNILQANDFEEAPVDIETFVTDRNYLGLSLGKNIYPRWMDHMKYYCEPDNKILEVFFTGPIGAGKTSIAVASILYQIYKLLCLKNPQAYYNIISDDIIAFAFFNVVLALAADVTFNKVAAMVDLSPYFKDQLAAKGERKLSEGMFFKKNLGILIGSKFSHGLGYNLFGGVINEANFFRVGQNTATSNIMETYTGILRRMESRFMQVGGIIPGQLYIVSSKKETSSFLEVHIESNKSNPRAYSIDEPIWKFKEHLNLYSGEIFKVMIGDQYADSKIITTIYQDLKSGNYVIDKETPELDYPEGYKIIEVPIEYGSSFSRQLNNSIRDIAGISTYGQLSLISNRSTLRRCFKAKVKDQDWVKPMKKDFFSLDFNNNNDRIMDYVNVGEFKDYLDLVGRSFPRTIHVDVGVSGDALGFAMSSISEMGLVENLNQKGEMQIDIEEKFRVEMMFRLMPKEGQQIPLMRVVNFIFELRRVFNLTLFKVTFDGYQSTVLMQQLQQLGFNTKLLSVDRTDIPYLSLRDVIDSERIESYENEDAILELSELIHYKDLRKVDHPMLFSNKEPGRKDLADAICGSLFSFLEMGLKEKSELKKYLPSAVDLYSDYSDNDEEDEFDEFVRADYLTQEQRTHLMQRFNKGN